MFYSQTFLARKGPLGTVWVAAHMQSRLKKSHYASTDIPSTVERIMFPEVPLALRMSSHLLLGVVRIYSKKVDILYDDCNAALSRLRKAFSSIDLSLPEDAMQAPVQAITLPDTFDLDAMDLDADLNLEDAHDHHHRSQEDITLIDQIPIGTEPYVSISFDEDIMTDISLPKHIPDSSGTATDQNSAPPAAVNTSEHVPSPSNQSGEENTRHTEENTLPDFTRNEVPDFVIPDTGPSNDAEMHEARNGNDNSPEDIPEVEVMRDAVPESSGNPLLSLNHSNDTVEPDASLDQILNEKETLSPIIENNLPSGGETPLFQPSSRPQPSTASLQDGGLLNDNVPVSFAIRSTPPVEKPKARPRKRKQLYDEAPVLTNKFMKKALEDPSELKRKRRKIPYSALGIWKLEKNLRKEKVFFEPLISGLCLDLCNVFDKDYMSTKLQSLKVASPEPGVVRSPAPETEASLEAAQVRCPASATEASPQHRGAEFRTPTHDYAQEIERLMHNVSHNEPNVLPEFIPSPRASPTIGRVATGLSTAQSLGSTPVTMAETTDGTGVFPTSDFHGSTGLWGSDLETPAFMDERTDLENTGLSDVPELNSAAEAEELSFLEADNNTPAASQGTLGVDSLSVRTRAMAQYLKRQSPINPISENSSEDLSLNWLLKGKTRKLCARMFFETLVLKSNGLIDAVQEMPYGDIILKLTPALSKAQI